MSDLVVILTTMPADDRAVGLARTLVAERLAACVNVHPPMVSIYRWQTVLEEEPERQLVIKTTRDRVEQVRARLRDLHPYELPEWIVLPAVEGSAEYAGWVRAETAVPGT
jgi:periplasmic divalent cation tolerance protein